MLDAYLKSKVKLPTHFEGARRTIEDPITSTLFTPLKFMSPHDAGKILSWIVDPASTSNIEVTRIDFWRRFRVDECALNAHTIEPDLIIDGQLEQEPARWIVEIKWDADLLRSQIDEQARLCARSGARNFHVSLVKTAELDAFQAPSSTIIQWNEVLSTLRNAGAREKGTGACAVWCADAIAFLEKLGVGTFKGFSHVCLEKVSISQPYQFSRRQWSLPELIDVTPSNFSI
ncbi:hypothetical protein [Bradyrhizobium sp. CCBAU 11357]|uniref:hypothetical protein n=1 Tax=Bradyrhizobium sp. CCBAU 11357 TaxID=1630808 RepID=UPI00230462FD|nr:hypothetical protein [Bradyrhizobium sp. CCBAU 11357]MDA9499548.1 hypothetical protein [Bradyrhizobium sp. CCBAU 11357]